MPRHRARTIAGFLLRAYTSTHLVLGVGTSAGIVVQEMVDPRVNARFSEEAHNLPLYGKLLVPGMYLPTAAYRSIKR
ncbi:MAG: hypothetical protein OXR66_05365 [Candidatus Woesearchaeota archaeon]|nr:hypothetical protein [Candidatus Woesearchaeota archaeon]